MLRTYVSLNIVSMYRVILTFNTLITNIHFVLIRIFMLLYLSFLSILWACIRLSSSHARVTSAVSCVINIVVCEAVWLQSTRMCCLMVTLVTEIFYTIMLCLRKFRYFGQFVLKSHSWHIKQILHVSSKMNS